MRRIGVCSLLCVEAKAVSVWLGRSNRIRFDDNEEVLRRLFAKPGTLRGLLWRDLRPEVWKTLRRSGMVGCV